jgi:hypothetical protein
MGDVPQPDPSAGVGCGEGLAVGAERHRVHGLRALRRAEESERGRVPQFDAAAGVSGREDLAVRAEREIGGRANAGLATENGTSCDHIPDFDPAAREAGRDCLTRRAEREVVKHRTEIDVRASGDRECRAGRQPRCLRAARPWDQPHVQANRERDHGKRRGKRGQHPKALTAAWVRLFAERSAVKEIPTRRGRQGSCSHRVRPVRDLPANRQVGHGERSPVSFPERVSRLPLADSSQAVAGQHGPVAVREEPVSHSAACGCVPSSSMRARSGKEAR